MKTTKILFAFLLFLFVAFKATAQSPAIKDLREIVSNSSSKFTKFKGEKFKENEGVLYFKTTKEHAAAESFIADQPSGNSQYFIIYRLDPSNSMMFKIQSLLLQQYVTEINDMVKTGKYDGKDSEEDGTSVTTITNKSDGKKALQLMSTKEYYALIVY